MFNKYKSLFKEKIIILFVVFILLITMDGFSDIIIVDCSGGGDFRKIQEGINAASAGDTVLVYPGSYYESVSVNDKNIEIGSLYYTTSDTSYISQTEIVSDSVSQYGVVVFTNDESSLVGFTIRRTTSPYTGIYCNNTQPNINHNIIYDFDVGVRVFGYCPYIYENVIYNNSEGIQLINSTNYRSPTINDNDIYNNEKGIVYSNSSVPIYNNLIHANENAGIICDWDSNTEILENIIFQNNIGLKICPGSELVINNNTFADNVTGILVYDDTNAEINNIIIYGNTYDIERQSPEISTDIEIAYCCIEDGVPGWCTNNGSNITNDPIFADPNNDDYSLTWDLNDFSPCIDAGDPDMDWDDDDTPPDMGALPTFAHDYFRDDYDGYSYDNIDWISFPVLNRITDDWMDAIEVLERQYLIDDDQYYLDDILDSVIYEDDAAVWFYNNNWVTNLTDGKFNSTQGYKFQLKEEYDSVAVQGISGTWLYPSTPIQLYPEQENWIGCYLIEPEYFDDAFESIEDEWLTISSEHWYAQRGSRVTNYTANPGELYIITVDTLCQLVWGDSLGSKGVIPFVKEKTEYFIYNEKIDYMAIDIDTVYSIIPVAEIAVYCDDECLGATKVYNNEYPVQILAYTFEGTNGGSGELEFMFYYEEGKGFSKSIPYITYDSNTHIYYQQSLYYKRKGYAKVKLNTKESTAIHNLKLLQNYPNPVRSNITTIHFMPEQNAEHTELSIYNIRGQLVRTIDCDAMISSGTQDVCYSISWDCKDGYGNDIKNGIYFYKLTSGEKSAVHKMLLMK